jgi:hypothetical protein
MRAVKAGLAPPFLGRGEEVLEESGPRSTAAVGTSHATLYVQRLSLEQLSSLLILKQTH